MKAYLNKRCFSNDNAFIESHGDIIWEQLCDCIPEDYFTIREAATRLPYLQVFDEAQRFRYLRAVLKNVTLEAESKGIRPAVKKRGMIWYWTDPE